LRLILVGGGHLDAATKARVAQMAPNARLHEFYGAAETSFITLSDATTPEGSVGAPYPGVEIDIRDGLVWVRSPYLFDHYAEGSSATTQTRKGWVTVGEMGEMRDGYLFLTGRADRMFTVADRNYHPEAAEAALSQIDGVHGVAVLPMMDDMRGAVPVALYHGMITPDDLQSAARTTGIQIRRTYRLSDWPALPSGKPNLTALAALLRNLT
jgi:long-chain acyl-CoA synthetase